METFRDAKAHEWVIDLTFGAVLRIKQASGGKFDLLDNPAELGQKLWIDLGEFYECLWFLIEPQAKAASIDAADFGERIAAACIVDARQKFFTEWISFFRSLQREELATALEKLIALNQQAAKLATAKAKAALNHEFDQKAMAKVEQAVNLAFGKLAESLESTPDHTPGANCT